MLPTIRSYLVYFRQPQSIAELVALGDVIANAMITDRQRSAPTNVVSGSDGTEARARVSCGETIWGKCLSE